jgi:tetratricopeptide (TPR) repeat protein
MEEESTEILLRLAELYLVNGLLGDALVQFRKVIQQYRKQGKPQEIMGLLRRMMGMDPDNIEVRTKCVELLRFEGFLAQALDEMIQLRAEHQTKGRLNLLPQTDAEIRALFQQLRSQLAQEGRETDVAEWNRKMQGLFTEPTPAAPPQPARVNGEIDLEEEPIEALEVAVEEEEEAPSGAESAAQQLREALVYAEHGLFDEAEELFHAILDMEPRHSEALRGLETVRKQRQQMILPTDSSSVFQKLKLLEEKHQQNVATDRKEKTSGLSEAKPAQDAKVHYELGLAYRELGLIDECVDELLLAAQDPSLALVCHREIAACHREKGDMEEASAHLRKALQCPGISQRELLDASYQLAQVLEMRGMREQALLLYQKIGEQDETFRDVKERVKSLSQ